MRAGVRVCGESDACVFARVCTGVHVCEGACIRSVTERVCMYMDVRVCDYVGVGVWACMFWVRM